jgi:hypothetical protein
MKYALLALLFFVNQAFAAAPMDWTYNVTPPIDRSQCPTPSGVMQPWDTNINCAYASIGAFTDTYNFTANGGVYSFRVEGSSSRVFVRSGRGQSQHTRSMDVSNVVVLDATGAVALQLVNVPFWSQRSCADSPPFRNCAPHESDRWTGSLDLPPGQYSLVLSGVVGSNRSASYHISIQPPPVQLPLAPLLLSGSATCADVCVFTPADASAVAMVSFDFNANVATLTPAVAPDLYSGPLTYELLGVVDDGTGTVFTYSFAGSAVVSNGVDAVTIVFSMDMIADNNTGTVTITNWQVSTQ